MIVDAHQHVCWYGKDAADLMENLDDCGIERAWALTWEIPPDGDTPQHHRIFNPVHARGDGTHPGMPLADVLAARERYPDRLLAGYCPDPARRDAPALLEAARRMHDVRICGEWKFRMLLDDPRTLELFAAAGELGMPVVLHLDVPYLCDGDTGKPTYQPNWYGGTIRNLARAAAACPETVFLGHGPGFWREISADADESGATRPDGPVDAPGRLQALLDDCANLHCDISAGSGLVALQRDRDYAREFLTRYADRVLFGRDNLLSDHRQFLDSLALSGETLAKIFSGNALRLAGSAGATV